ncbi:hypothetical protein ASC77_19545 [Nocardioides sp. Root1257]|uniref:hypothetical protein n=1 Tax=unclassified Nocardioides TaxID=2615069 RepID=UPI0006F1EC32|nr:MULTISPECIES: hypothetical protein [unclassified Nocardioides]KQW44984.1 hypothetical protein ASC77_19545 [Nocardioides sp. Root1257]KRC46012.1 hypothetical protein ASE24_15675 [Nocardioides sp. Root224]
MQNSAEVVDVNLLDRIDQRLSDTRARINPHDFENCATSLLSPLHPGLVPITGGTDFGLDAEITDDERTTGLIVTSSRSWDGAKKSLRDSLRSMRKNKVPVDRVVVVNLAEANRSKREKLKDIAKEFDCELVQVYDRAWFANQFRENPDWRRKILGIEGGPYSFSRQPRGARPDEQQLATIGRDALIAEVNESDTDVTLFGVPGVGKSHVASKLEGALFLERQPTPERLLDDLIETRPALVIVDDAGARLQDLNLLLLLRDAEKLEYRIVATCWPHEIDRVADHLPKSVQFEVDLLTREELGAILRERGITRLSVIVHLLTQADGRPAWALNLADLLIHESDWKSVWTGNALRDQIFGFLRMSKASEDAVDVLGTLALLGQVNDDQVRRLADLLQIRQPELIRLIRSVAIAGLVDVQDHKHYNHETKQIEHTQTYRVQPHIIAASVASEVYFSGAASPVRLSDVKDAFPELAADIMQIQIYTKLLGATHPRVPTTADLIAVRPDAKKDVELLRSFGQLGPEQGQAVVDIHFARVTTALNTGYPTTAESEAKLLAARVADAVESNIPGVVRTFVEALTLLEGAGRDIKPAVKELVEEVRNARSGDQPQLADLMKLVEALQSVPDADLTDTVRVALASETLAPTFDGNYMNPEVLHQFILQSFTWAATHMETLYDSLQPALATRAPGLTPALQLELIDLLDKWVRIANGWALPFGGKTNKAQVRAGKRIAKDIASTLAPTIITPGVRARFNKTASTLKIRLDEPDKLFAALTQDRERLTDYEEVMRRKEAALDKALAPFQQQAPDVLMEWLKTHEPELATAGQTTTGTWQVFARLAYQPDPDPMKWLTAAIDHGLAGSASALIDVCARTDQFTTTKIADRLLAEPNSRHGVISAVVSQSTHSALVQRVVDQLTPDDLQQLESGFVLKHAPEPTRRALFTHPNQDVRGTAAALWAAEWTYDNDPRPEDSDWLNAMKSYTVPENSRRDYIHTQALNALAKASPEVFIELFTRHATNTMPGSYRDLDEWEEPVRLLTPAERTKLWQNVKGTELARELFWVIAGRNTDWITEAVSDPTFNIPVRRLLGALQFQFGPRYSLDTLATMLRPLNPDPDDLLHTLEVGTFSGEDHERYAAKLDNLRDLATSDDEDIARLGRRGIEIYEPLLKEALAQARRAAVRGTRDY